MKRRISVKERLELQLYTGTDRDTLLTDDRLEERARRVPRSTLRPIEKPIPRDTDRLLSEFKHDCFDELGLDGHPRAEQAFALAMELSGHELSRCFDLLSTLAGLMVPKDDVTGWIEVQWIISQATQGCEDRRHRHAAIKSAINQLIDLTLEPDDD